MPPISRQRRVLGALRRDPRLTELGLAALLDLTPAAIRDTLRALEARGLIAGRGWLLGARRSVVVVGGAVMDLKMQIRDEPALGTSNPGAASWTPGGVGRNIAEILGRLGSPVELVATIGSDPPGVELAERTRAAGVGIDHLIRTASPTGIYSAIVDSSGELVIGVSDLQATEDITVRHLAPSQALLAEADLVVLDGNLPEAVTGWLLDFTAASQTPVVIDTVSVAKAERIGALLAPGRPVHTVTPNVGELAGLVGSDVADEPDSLTAAAAHLHDRGVANVWIRRGVRGSLLSTGEDGAQQVAHFPAPDAAVVDVTGAGDSMTAGYVHAWLGTGDVHHAARYGQAVASLTVESLHTVRPDLSEAVVEERLARTDRGAR